MRLPLDKGRIFIFIKFNLFSSLLNTIGGLLNLGSRAFVVLLEQECQWTS